MNGLAQGRTGAPVADTDVLCIVVNDQKPLPSPPCASWGARLAAAAAVPQLPPLQVAGWVLLCIMANGAWGLIGVSARFIQVWP